MNNMNVTPHTHSSLWLALLLLTAAAIVLSFVGCASSNLSRGLQVGVVASQGADLATTHMAIQSGRGVEGNPVAPVTAGVLWASTRLEQQGHPTMAKILLATVAGSVAIISARNYSISRGVR